MLIGFLLVVSKGNRHWQAWLILIPLLLLAQLRLVMTMLPVPLFFTEVLFFPFTSLAMTWIIVWLIGHWLSRLHWTAALLLALAVMLTAGGASYVCHFGTAYRTIWDVPDALPLFMLYIIYGICVAVLLLAMTLSGYCCRKRYRPRRFMLWLLLWIILASMAGACCFFILSGLWVMEFSPPLVPRSEVLMAIAFGSLIMGVIVGGILYLMNLSVVVFAFHCPCYHHRFHDVFRLPGRRWAELTLSGTKITDAGLEHLRGMTNLRNLHLNDTQVTDAGLEHLKGPANLKWLNLDNTEITDTGVEYLKRQTNLRNLHLNNTQITDAGVNELKKALPNCEIYPSAEQIRQRIQEQLANVVKLGQEKAIAEIEKLGGRVSNARTTVFLAKTDITDAGLVHLKGLTKLRELNLVGTKVTDAGLEHLKGMTNLRNLYLENTQITLTGVWKFQEALPDCQIRC